MQWKSRRSDIIEGQSQSGVGHQFLYCAWLRTRLALDSTTRVNYPPRKAIGVLR